MKDKGKVSVVVPIYNVESYLIRCIDSILGQTYQNLEVILIDDGATDRSGEIVDQYAAKDQRIVPIHKKNGGLSDARNAGIETASGEYICFVDADDLLHPDYVELMLEQCVSYGCDIVQCRFERSSVGTFTSERGNGDVIIYDSVGILNAIYSSLSVETIVVWNKLYKRELFDQVRFPQGRIHEDEATSYKVLYKAKKIARIDKVLYLYYQNRASITQQTYSLKRLDILTALEERMSFFKEHNLIQLYEKDSYKYLCKLLIQYYLVSKMDTVNMVVLKNLKKKYWLKLKESKTFEWSVKRKCALIFWGMFPRLYVPLIRKDNY